MQPSTSQHTLIAADRLRIGRRDMSKSLRTCTVGLIFLGSTTALHAASPDLDVGAIKSAVQKSIPLIEKSAAQYRERRQCFSCHHHALPVLMLTEARRRGFTIDEGNLERQLDYTAAHLKRGEENYRSGQGQGGKADTAGWALWTLETGGRKADETTAAVAHFLLAWQSDQDHWRAAGKRPPTEASAFTTTYVAVRGLANFGTADSDAYATGTALVALHESSELSASDSVYRKGIDYLRRTQLDDGSWKVATRSKPIQEYFESGFPHEKDQFISISATSWAATALLMACPLATP
jgi:N-acyl-D-amino-acid deacylase